MPSGRAVVIRGDAASLPLPGASVDLIVTSPPYFGLRSYTDGGQHYDGQIGSEPTPAAYIAALIGCTREWVRVLKPEGSLFVNLGDKYSGAQAQNYNGISNRGAPDSAEFWRRTDPKRTGIPNKSLLGLPWRYALACTDSLGLILRAEIIWDKPNGLPESVTDRVRRCHEQVFHFTRQPRYYTAIDEIREPHANGGKGMTWDERKADPNAPKSGWRESGNRGTMAAIGTFAGNPLGKLPGSVWSIPSAPLTVPGHLGVDHFAAYPPELVRRIILGWSPPGICTECGQGRRPVTVKGLQVRQRHLTDRQDGNGDNHWGTAWRSLGGATEATITGYACACPHPDAPARPAVILDPFGGTGTTMLVAAAYGRLGIGIDRSADYCRLANWRVHDPAERARALHVHKPPPVPDGQASLFDDWEAAL